MFNKNFWRPTLLYIILAELLSLAIFLLPDLKTFAFILVASIFLIFSLFDLKYGILIILAELIMGSKGGYLFSLDMDNNTLSIRIAFWLIIMSVWFGTVLIPALIKGKTKRFLILNNTWFKYFGVLIFFVLWGLLNGFLNHNSFANIFFDFNAYLYFLLIFPLFSLLVDKDKSSIKKTTSEIVQVFSVATLWISIKTLILLFLFSHKLDFINSYLYSWVRSSGVGEITQVQGGFYRIFFQSHIFVLLAFVAFSIFLISFINKQKINFKSLIKNKNLIYTFSILLILLMTTLVSMSRSNWVGFIVAIVLLAIFSYTRYKYKGFINFSLLFLSLLIISFVLIVVLVKFPYPKAIGGFTTGDLLTERASEIKNEAGVSSRWNLLPELSKKIKSSPFLGRGFGSTVTYVSNDPRVRNNNKDGIYTTFAFEWGWLDIFLKLEFLGVLSYFSFLIIVIIKTFKNLLFLKHADRDIITTLLISVISLSAINFFSPYLNHPLGIGMILFSIFIIDSLLKQARDI